MHRFNRCTKHDFLFIIVIILITNNFLFCKLVSKLNNIVTNSFWSLQLIVNEIFSSNESNTNCLYCHIKNCHAIILLQKKNYIYLFYINYRLKYTFGPYFRQNYSIWSIFSLCGQFGPHFCKIAFNQVLLANNVKIVNDTVTTWNCLGDVAVFCSDVGTVFI